MNMNPKTFTATMWSDFKTSKDLTNFIEDQTQDMLEDTPYITKAWLADTLEMLQDIGEDPAMVTELANVARVVRIKGIQIIIL